MSNITFNIVEGGTDFSEELLEKIRYDYYENLNLTVKQIQRKYGLNNKKWVKIRNKLIDDYGFSNRMNNHQCNTKHKKERNVKNYYRNTYGNKYYVVKRIEGEDVYFGSFSSEKEAQKCVELCKARNWDKNEKSRIINEVLICA